MSKELVLVGGKYDGALIPVGRETPLEYEKDGELYKRVVVMYSGKKAEFYAFHKLEKVEAIKIILNEYGDR